MGTAVGSLVARGPESGPMVLWRYRETCPTKVVETPLRVRVLYYLTIAACQMSAAPFALFRFRFRLVALPLSFVSEGLVVSRLFESVCCE